ncbi:MAG: DUF1722 domain-containing protein [Candidatus Lokiarchaeota archaeon]|nr:DUF1722 domain-containing protein [Candidatus Lokiarchaeota archaeon]MBD3341432.1 DUF1722 domain-containing protein [Candidatus Lokiarchaeota archaeon]
MNEFPKPIVIISKCIEFEFCRWNGMIIKSPFVKILKKFVDFRPVCAEVEIGLGVPRDPVRLVLKNDELRMIQPKSMNDYTSKMKNFSNRFLDSLDLVDGFLLKSDSPSCGILHTKHYQSAERGAPTLARGPGLFGKAVLERFPKKAIESEGRLTNFRIREHWLNKLYCLADFRIVKSSDSMYELVKFHTKNKFRFMAYQQHIMREMGKIVANPNKSSFEEIVRVYEDKLNTLLNHPPAYTAHINAMMHALGYFKNKLSSEEKAFFLDELEKYRAGWIPLFILINLINSWIIRFDEEYLEEQTYFNPYPEKLMNFDLRDSWRGRSYWNKTK